MEAAFSLLMAFPIALMGAGRTDAGVHAKKMVAHFDADEIKDPAHLTARLNAFLSQDIAIQKIYKVGAEAHARFHATARTYEYWISRTKNPFTAEAAYYLHQDLNLKAMNEAAQMLLGYEDFECFSKSQSEVHTFLCQISHAVWEQQGDLLVFTITANRFLRNMVRAIVGTLLEIGMNKKTLSDFEAVILSKSRTNAGPSVPAQGLYLTEIIYPSSTYV